MQIKIKTVLAHQQQRESEDAKKELAAIQEYVDNSVENLEEETIYFIPLQGNYVHVKRTMVLAGVIISTLQKGIQGIVGHLSTEIRGSKAEVTGIKFEFPPEFLGRLNYAEGFPIHFEIPVKGLTEDKQIKSSSFDCKLSDVKILSMDDMEEENENS